jgi:hypothetical protein
VVEVGEFCQRGVKCKRGALAARRRRTRVAAPSGTLGAAADDQWSVLLGCAFGTVPVLIIHFAIGYTHFEHLPPVYVLVAASVIALALSKGYLTAHVAPLATASLSAEHPGRP